MRRSFFLSMPVGLILLLAGSETFDAGANVRITNFTFDPPVLTVPVGSTVTWTNDDDIVHVLKENGDTFHSGALDTGDSFSQTFTVPGTIDYFCAIHPRMTGKIVVVP